MEGVFNTAKEIVKFLVDYKSVKHSLYLENPNKSDIKGAELFFTDNSHIIMGLFSVTKYPNTDIEDSLFREMKKFCSSDEGYITYEDPPPLNRSEFRELIKAF